MLQWSTLMMKVILSRSAQVTVRTVFHKCTRVANNTQDTRAEGQMSMNRCVNGYTINILTGIYRMTEKIGLALYHHKSKNAKPHSMVKEIY